MDENESKSEEEFKALSHNHQNRNIIDDYPIKTDNPPFFGNMKIEDFLDWLVEMNYDIPNP